MVAGYRRNREGIAPCSKGTQRLPFRRHRPSHWGRPADFEVLAVPTLGPLAVPDLPVDYSGRIAHFRIHGSVVGSGSRPLPSERWLVRVIIVPVSSVWSLHCAGCYLGLDVASRERLLWQLNTHHRNNRPE
jgi:hypothetical protein